MKYNRNELGLLEGIEYERNEDGSVNWRAMIGAEHLYPNKGWFEDRNKPVPSSIDGLKDYQLLIKLSGIKELARLRGFTKVHYDFIKCELDHVAVKCSIDWIGNYESGGEVIHFQDAGNATAYNTSSFAQKFLETIAVNRAFVRCVRNFLNIHIVGSDEIDTSNNKTSIPVVQASEKYSPLSILTSQLHLDPNNENDFTTFKGIVKSLCNSGKYKNDSISSWSNWGDIPEKELSKISRILKINE